MGLRIYLLLVYLLTKKDTATSLSLSCRADVIEVVEGRQKTVTCLGLRAVDTVKWSMEISNDLIHLGTCSPTSAAGVFTCTDPDVSFVTSSRTLGTESVLAIDFTNSNDALIRANLGTLKCEILGTGTFDACQIDFVYPPEGNCAVQILKDVSPWRVQGFCNVTKALSFLGRYSCQWYLEREVSVKFGPSVNMTTRTAQSNGRYVSGSCEMPPNMQFPTTAGSLIFKVAFTPERNVTATADGISEVQRPSQPTVNCDPKPYVPENTSVSCTCHTESVGVPGGYLKWSKGSKNIFNTVINIGTFNVMSLSMVPYILQKIDHNNTQFRCDVVWAENITGSVYTASVGYIEQPKLSINSSQNITVMENQVVVFNCQAVGIPVPTLRLIDINANKQLTVQNSPMFYTIAVATCEDTTTYTCVATNSVTGGQNNSAQLYVNCKPRSNPPLTTPQELSPVNYRNKREEQAFTVVAYPSPDNFTFIYLGLNRNLTISVKAATDIYLKVTCSSTKLVYVSNCTLTVDNVSSSAVGVYQVTIGNAFGSETFTFKVNVNGAIPTESSVDETNAAAIGGGIAAGVIVIAVIIVIVIVNLKRRNKGKTDSSRSCFKDKSPLHKRQKDDSDPECRNRAVDGSKINHAYSPEPQQTEPPKTTVTNKQGVIKEIDPPTASNSCTNQARAISNLPLLMQPPVLQPGSKPKFGKSDKSKRKKGKKYEGTKDCKEGEYENVSLPTQATAGDGKRNPHQNKTKGKESHTNAEGITYMELEFSQSKNNKPVQPKPVEEHVEYAPIDFSKHTS